MRHFIFLVLAFSIPFCLGCSQGEDLVLVSGTVTLDGSPLDDATLQLDARDGSTPVSLQIENGEFSGKATAGSKTVRFFAMRQSENSNEQSPTASSKEGMKPPHSNALPAKYGMQSKMKLEVETEGNSGLTFELNSK